MKTKAGVLGLFLLLLIAFAPANASTIFADNFNSYNGGIGALNYTGFAGNWNVSGGTVDLIGNGFFDFIPGNGLYIDLDGSTNQSGLFTHDFNLAPGTYTLQFDLAGTHRGTTDSVTVSLGGLYNNVFTLNSGDPLTTYSTTFTVAVPTTVALGFQDFSNNNVGILLDNVQLTSTPEPSSLILLGVGLMGAAGTLRRRLVKK